jgi:hypothetical protein
VFHFSGRLYVVPTCTQQVAYAVHTFHLYVVVVVCCMCVLGHALEVCWVNGVADLVGIGAQPHCSAIAVAAAASTANIASAAESRHLQLVACNVVFIITCVWGGDQTWAGFAEWQTWSA